MVSWSQVGGQCSSIVLYIISTYNYYCWTYCSIIIILEIIVISIACIIIKHCWLCSCTVGIITVTTTITITITIAIPFTITITYSSLLCYDYVWYIYIFLGLGPKRTQSTRNCTPERLSNCARCSFAASKQNPGQFLLLEDLHVGITVSLRWPLHVACESSPFKQFTKSLTYTNLY